MRRRQSSRALLINAKNELFLFKFEFAMLSDHRTLWVTPGGGLEEGETFEQALERELREELGILATGPHRWLYYRNRPFTTKSGEEFLSEERYYLVRADSTEFSFDSMTGVEKKLTKDWKWWSAEEIGRSQEEFFADDLHIKLRHIFTEPLPQGPMEI